MDVYDKVKKIKGDNINQVGEVQSVWQTSFGAVATVLWLFNGEGTYMTVEKLTNLKIVEAYNGE